MILFGFDFSMSKPAMCCYDTNTEHVSFYTWPAQLDKKSKEIISSNDVIVRNRELDKMSKKGSNNQLILEHTKRATELADIIIKDMFDIIKDTPLKEVYVASEGLSFGSRGNAVLDLSGYKYTLLTELYRKGIHNLFTYPPTSIKSVAKMGRQLEKFDYSKDFMIESAKLTNPNKHKLINTLVFNSDNLKKTKNYVTTLDDLIDSYWVLRTMCEKEFNNFSYLD